MLQYRTNESANSSHFFITTERESLHLLSFQKIEEEEIYFNNNFLQDNAVQMTIARLTEKREDGCPALAETVKGIFDNLLFKNDDFVIYLSVKSKTGKDNLLKRYIAEDNNDEFSCFNVDVNDYSFYFFFNIEKTNPVTCLSSIFEFFKSEYNIDLTFNKKDKKE